MRTLAALALAAGLAHAASADERCDRAVDGVKGMRVVGHFAYDRGCIWAGYVLDGKTRKLSESALALERRGWRSADPAARAELATWWIRDVLLAPGDLVDADEAKREKRVKLEPPKTSAREDGGVLFVGWAQLPSGMRPVAQWGRMEVVFDGGGHVTSEKTTAFREAPIQ